MRPGRIALAGLLLALTACGESPGGGGDLLGPAPLPGVYALDVARTTRGRIRDADGHDVSVPPEVLETVQAGSTPEELRLTLKADGTFELFLENGEVDFTSAGTWVETEDGVDLTTTTIEGQPAPAEMRLTDTYRREDGYLVAVPAEGMQVFYLQRQSDTR
jgi:hypothetical protein